MWKDHFYSETWSEQSFGDIIDAFWISKIILSSETEDQIRHFFNQKVQFGYPEDLDEFNFLI